MNLQTIQEVNDASEGCCPCPWPECGGRAQCESRIGSADASGYAPFIDPGGTGTDDLPAIYRSLDPFSELTYHGTGWSYVSGAGTAPFSAEIKTTGVFNGPGDVGDLSAVGNEHNATTEACGPFAATPNILFTAPGSVSTWTPSDPRSTSTATECSTSDVSISVEGTEPFLLGCPGPFEEDLIYAWDYEKRETAGSRLSDSVTKAELIAEAIDTVPVTWPTTPDSTLCSARTEIDWPLLQEFRTWPACEDGPPDAFATADVRRVRYRHGVPENYSTIARPRTTWEESWDEVFASLAWWEWFDGGMIGTEPSPGPSLVTHRTWTWAGDMAIPWSDWFVIEPPETPGEVRVVNRLVTCWRSTRQGHKPSLIGDAVALPAPP